MQKQINVNVEGLEQLSRDERTALAIAILHNAGYNVDATKTPSGATVLWAFPNAAPAGVRTGGQAADAWNEIAGALRGFLRSVEIAAGQVQRFVAERAS